MSYHLPECLLASDCKHEYYDEPPIQCANCGEECICDRLRACEARVRSERYTVSGQGCSHGDKYLRREGYAAGLAAARDAVAALPGTGSAVPGEGKVLGRANAIAAIDALRGDA